jgi:hypothetical protein
MGSTVIINRTSNALDMKMGNHRFFTKMATVAKNASYTLKVGSNDTYQEFRLEAVNDVNGANAVTVNSDDCVDNKTIIITEEQGKMQMETEPRVSRAIANSHPPEATDNAAKKKSKWFFRW